MSINFTTDAAGLWTTKVVTDAEYLAIDPTRRNDAFEKNLLTMIEITRGFMAELRDEDQARMFHYAMGRMMAGMAYGPLYKNLMVTASGNTDSVHVSAVNGDTVSLTDSTGTANVVLAAAPYASLDALVTDINSQLAGTASVEAFNSGGVLGFRNTASKIGDAFTLAYGAGPSLLHKAGIAAGEHFNPVETQANDARDDAIAHFERSANPVTP